MDSNTAVDEEAVGKEAEGEEAVTFLPPQHYRLRTYRLSNYRLFIYHLTQVLLDLPFERHLGHCADHGVDVLPVLEEEDAGNGPHVEPHGRPLI